MNTSGPLTLARTQCGNGFTCTCDVTPPKFCPQHMDSPEITQPTTQKYVAGFYFDPSGEHVLLVRKNRPKWQAGKLNGIGGHIEPGERAGDAMTREFQEETGVWVPNWRHFAALRGNGFLVHFFEIRSRFPIYKSMTDEEISIYRVDELLVGLYPMISNLRWLLPLALDKDKVTAEIQDPSLPGEGA